MKLCPPLLLCTVIALTACSTPVTKLQHPKSKKEVACGGSNAASVAGGAIGYHIQKDKDADCVSAYEKQGYKVIP